MNNKYNGYDISFVYKGTNKRPDYKTTGSAGFDLPIEQPDWTPDNPYELMPFSTILVPTGMYFDYCARSLEVQIRSRSGLSLKHNVIVLNAPATIDSDYRGEWKVVLYNAHPYNSFSLHHGMRIAQGVISEVVRPVGGLYFVDKQQELNTDRGLGGFGSTGV